MDHLVRYYVMTRPIGWWGPVHRQAVQRGLIQETLQPTTTTKGTTTTRPLIRRTWTPEQADAWTREDWLVVMLSPLVFAALMIGVTKLLLLQIGGVFLILSAVIGTGLMYWIIDPKLRAVSHEYEVQQAQYIEQLEESMQWQEGGER